MSQQKRPDQGDATHSRAHVRNAVALIMQGPAAYTDLNNIQNIQNIFPRLDFATRHRHDNPGKGCEIVPFTDKGVTFWIIVDRGVGRGAQVTSDQQIQQQNWQRKIGEKVADEQWPILGDRIRKSDEVTTAWWQDPNYMAWFEATKNMIITSTLASNSNSSTTSHGGGGTYTAGSQYSGGAQYPGGQPRQNPLRDTSGRGAGYSGHHHHHKNPY
ncbi:hypothetical protein BOTNAR_0118g00060 [Botryotinia narcissicola]|uniref:Uncharacterized protein n=1 Tax=Botryotinia narcissicola TaxID=278944 RepID=A0A4Z1IS59_9HELO|nr:hypothetical protein BOTNAR_0118g00060 [Botryotinia narcissicola]